MRWWVLEPPRPPPTQHACHISHKTQPRLCYTSRLLLLKPPGHQKSHTVAAVKWFSKTSVCTISAWSLRASLQNMLLQLKVFQVIYWFSSWQPVYFHRSPFKKPTSDEPRLHHLSTMAEPHHTMWLLTGTDQEAWRLPPNIPLSYKAFTELYLACLIINWAA